MNLYQNSSKILIILLSIILSSCNNNDKENELLIPKDKFISVLTDINLADATLSYMQPDKSWKGISAESYYPSVLKKNNLTREQFEYTVKYYIDRPKEYEDIYEKVISKFSIMQGDLHEEVIKNKVEKDKAKAKKTEKKKD